VSLVDLDIQFGSLCHYLDMDPKYGLLEALQNVYELDKHALEGYMLKHKSGLHLLDVKPGDLLLPEDICHEHMDALLKVLSQNYDHVVVDLPRHIGMLSSVVLEKSEKIIIVLQQNISHLRDAKRLLEILKNDIGVDNEKIRIVLNRHSKQADLTVEDISKALRHPVNLTIPNSFDQVSESINQGIPLYNVSQKSAITKAMMDVGDDLSGGSVIHQKTGFVGRIINNLKGV
jgi:pilus assembly protein CpaE